MLVSIRTALLTLAVFATLGHVVLLFGAPHAVTRLVVGRSADLAPVNTIGHVELPTPGGGGIGPSPDLLYSVCVYDVSQRALRVTAVMPPSYWSMSVYAANTDLMGVVNDSAAVDGRIERVIALAGTALPGPDVIQVSSPRGLAIFRTLVPDLDHSQDIDSIRRQTHCEPVH
jgi:uncharacterized membrane protein